MWAPHVTVATVVEREGRFLMVKEYEANRIVINQPAGHVEKDESIIQAAIRECLEETRWRIKITHAIGISQLTAPNGNTYFRHSFIGQAIEEVHIATLDPDIIEPIWMTMKQIEKDQAMHRSEMVMNDLQRFVRGAHIPVDMFYGNLR